MNEIITFGRGYKLTPGIKVFVKSAKQICSNVTVICADLDLELVRFLKEHQVNIINANDIAKEWNVNMSISPYTLKVIFFYLYCKYLCKNTNLYLCDFTDVYFQKNLFEIVTNDKPYVTSENVLISNCQTNTTWINICYNKDIYGLLKKYDILNGGSILGYKENVTDLLKEMCADMTQIISRIGNYQNIDQASLNKVVYFDKHRYNILSNYEIFNLAHHGAASVNLSVNNITVNNKTSYVIHQYDVIKTLENFLYEQYK